MVEAGANEIPEAEILDALDIAHSAIKKICAAPIASWPPRPARRRSSSWRPRPTRTCSTRSGAAMATISTRRPRSSTSSSARTPPRPSGEGRRAVRRRRVRRGPRGQDRDGQVALRQAREADDPRAHRRPQEAPGRSRRGGDPPADIEAGVLPRTHGSALFTRGQTQALSVVALGTTREEMRMDTLGLETSQALLPPLQLPAVLGGRGRLHARPQAPRHRPRCARGARARAGDPVPGRLPVHDPRGLGHPRVQRFVVDGVGLWLVAVADGRGRADQGARSRVWPWV